MTVLCCCIAQRLDEACTMGQACTNETQVSSQHPLSETNFAKLSKMAKSDSVINNIARPPSVTNLAALGIESDAADM